MLSEFVLHPDPLANSYYQHYCALLYFQGTVVYCRYGQGLAFDSLVLLTVECFHRIPLLQLVMAPCASLDVAIEAELALRTIVGWLAAGAGH